VPKTRSLHLYLDTLLEVIDGPQKAVPAQAFASTISVNGRPAAVKLTVP